MEATDTNKGMTTVSGKPIAAGDKPYTLHQLKHRYLNDFSFHIAVDTIMKASGLQGDDQQIFMLEIGWALIEFERREKLKTERTIRVAALESCDWAGVVRLASQRVVIGGRCLKETTCIHMNGHEGECEQADFRPRQDTVSGTSTGSPL